MATSPAASPRTWSRNEREDLPLSGNSLQHVASAILELQARAGDQVHHRSGDQDLAGACECGDPGADVDRDARNVGALELDLARVQARSDLQARLADGIADGHRATDGPSRTVERGQDPVSGRMDLPPPVPGELSPDDALVLADELLPSTVPQLGSRGGRADDVREQDGGQDPVRRSDAPRAGEELLDFVQDRLGAPGPERVPHAGQLLVDGPGDV